MNINPTSGRPLYEQLMFGIKQDILLGILQPGDKLPSVREMAQQQLVNPNTVAKAYKALEGQGVIDTVLGRGTFVAENSNDLGPDRQQMNQFKRQLNDLLTEGMYIGLSRQEIIDLMSEWYGGTHEARR
ncbi:GntR family transcriptional regulator [Periweissella fabalis]|uniref:GntR family transcriptional regulator n=1 Tax=Periweissella fabalis TaxID=1070421 RepID=A0A7X6N111_9LACO|nr:GntR family transcriptional regulator [Periweissella fabalis]MCM0599467.1 GntR family transcriptional regulator [Periweissella fabalis]NKZ23746.1 GntR family transcriptional regulator [Periweissella fabalis]